MNDSSSLIDRKYTRIISRFYDYNLFNFIEKLYDF